MRSRRPHASSRAGRPCADRDFRASRPAVDGTIHEFLSEGSASDIEFHDDDDTAVWRIGDANAQEIIELLTDMRQNLGMGHYYVDVSTPVRTLVISLNEYA
ncbi:hypothetical protein AAHS21_13575 [Mycobacterium sp. 050272]|uniref:hypothetical protein n=1 Tax=Mycobacterium sp. 050272 TaxID=3142488 RepID=UPI003193608A